MWICRIIPIAFLIFYFSALLWPDLLLPSPLFEISFMLILGSYLLLIFGLIPQLIYKGTYRIFGFGHWKYFLLACLTSGLGPVVWYLLKVDPLLRKMPSDLDHWPNQSGEGTARKRAE